MNVKRTALRAARNLLLVVVAVLVLFSFATPFSVNGYAMYPTISPGSYVLVNKIPYLVIEPNYGDVILFREKTDDDKNVGEKRIMRVVGLPGDMIEIKRGVLYRNGNAVEEPYVSAKVTPVNVSLRTVEEKCIYVMGDDRGRSDVVTELADGQIPTMNIIGRVEVKIFPFDQIGAIE